MQADIFYESWKYLTSPGVKILEFKSNRRRQDFPKSKIYTNHLNQNILEGGNFWGVQIRGGGGFFHLRKC